MNAYIDYIMRMSDSRLEDLRREAAHDRLVRALTSRRTSDRRRRRAAAPAPATPMRLPVRHAPEMPLRRTA